MCCPIPALESSSQYVELCFYNLSGDTDQGSRLAAFFGNAHLPMTKRLGIAPVDYFELREPPAGSTVKDNAPRIVTLAAYDSWSAVEGKRAARGADKEWTQAVDELTAKAPAFDRVESWLLRAFDGLPKIEAPPFGKGNNPRLFDLRIAESPCFRTAALKIEQFNLGEIRIFRRCGLNPVFFAETLFGSKMPNLWFMVWCDGPEARQAAWEAFRKDPEWVEMQKNPRWAKTVFRFADAFLQPLPFSPIR